MKITDAISITELARIMHKTRPTIYKYVTCYENGDFSAVPEGVKVLFDGITQNNISKRDIYDYCELRFDAFGNENGATLAEIFTVLRENEKNLDLEKIKRYILQEIKK